MRRQKKATYLIAEIQENNYITKPETKRTTHI